MCRAGASYTPEGAETLAILSGLIADADHRTAERLEYAVTAVRAREWDRFTRRIHEEAGKAWKAKYPGLPWAGELPPAD